MSARARAHTHTHTSGCQHSTLSTHNNNSVDLTKKNTIAWMAYKL